MFKIRYKIWLVVQYAKGPFSSSCQQCCGYRSVSESGLDPDSVGPLDPYPDLDCAGCSLLRAEGFSCSLDISELQI
jgi:hypothetical protein